ncbi:MAG: methyltransferase domain-containing protein [Pseudohongiellaceae bacterium]
MALPVSHSSANVADVLVRFLPLLKQNNTGAKCLDLACGQGRNGLWLARRNLPVVFADRDAEALRRVRGALDLEHLHGEIWQVDFEKEAEENPLAVRGAAFDAIVVFNYLHRPLIPAIRNSIRPGGLIVYETFTAKQALFGRPRNPDYLLRPGELQTFFQGWSIIYSNEGETVNPRRAFASIIARKEGDGSVKCARQK